MSINVTIWVDEKLTWNTLKFSNGCISGSLSNPGNLFRDHSEKILASVTPNLVKFLSMKLASLLLPAVLLLSNCAPTHVTLTLEGKLQAGPNKTKGVQFPVTSYNPAVGIKGTLTNTIGFRSANSTISHLSVGCTTSQLFSSKGISGTIDYLDSAGKVLQSIPAIDPSSKPQDLLIGCGPGFWNSIYASRLLTPETVENAVSVRANFEGDFEKCPK